MATRKEIQSALQHPYDRMLFSKQVLHPVFGSSFKLLESVQKPFVEPTKSESSVISEVLIYGTITLEDGTDITCYEVTLQPTVRIEQSKVAIQQYVRKLLISGQAALINFIAPKDKDIWRFTLVAKDSKITDEGIAETQTHPQRYTYLVEKDRPNRTMAERLETLSLESEIDLEKLIKAFSVEAMSKAFFDEYKEHYQNFVEYLTGKRMVKQGGKWVEKQTGKASPFLASLFNGNEKDARDFIKKLMGRIVFLYFVQKKRWLGASTADYNDGPYDFIFKLFDQTGGDERFFPVGLSELFFNALNKERKDDDWKMPSGKVVKIPYLNGGLFVRDEIDEKIHKKGDLLTFPPGLFSHVDKMDTPNDRGFLDFLNAYNFTVYEDSQDDHTIAVDPEMLGHIFENLLEDNKDKGAFYTPKEIVHYMCQESLIEYLATNLAKEYKVYRQLDDDQVELFGNETNVGQLKMIVELGDKALNRNEVEHIVKDKDIKKLSERQLQRIDELLDSVKICDPAIGSGAFPMGLLQEIFSIKEASAYLLDKPFNAARTKENIISNSIYGVDIERGAVDIARLRFWLSLVVDEERPKALPNLDYKIVVGNSLVSQFEDKIIEVDWKIEPGKQFDMFGNQQEQNRLHLVNEISKKQRQFFDPELSKEKTKLKLQIKNLKIDILINQLELMLNTKGQKEVPTENINEKETSFEQRTLKHIASISWSDTIKKLEHLKKNPTSKFNHFDWYLDFPEVLNPTVTDNAGFDILIGNPPYIGEKGNEKVFHQIVGTNLHSKFYTRWMDYFYYFFHQGLNLLKENATMSFITTNYYLTSTGGNKLRQDLKKRSSILKIINFNTMNIFESAKGQHNAITFLQKKVSNIYSNNILVDHEGTKSASLSSVLKETSPFIAKNRILQSELYDGSDYQIRISGSGINSSSLSIESILHDINKNCQNKLIDLTDITMGIVTLSDTVSNKHLREYPEINAKKGDGIYVLTQSEIEKKNLLHSEYLKPFYKNSDIGKYHCKKDNTLWLLYLKDAGVPIKLDNDLKRHFTSYEPLIRGLKENFLKNEIAASVVKKWFSRGNYFVLFTPKKETYFIGDKIVAPYRSKSNDFAFNDIPWFGSKDVCYILPKKNTISLKYLLPILNSKLIYAWLYHKGKRKGETLELYKKPLSDIPIVINPKFFNALETLGNYLTHLFESNKNAPLSNWFNMLAESLVYELYLPKQFKAYQKSVLEYLTDLPAMTNEMTNDEKLVVCKKAYTKLNDPSHPLRKNLDTLNEIPEVAIIEGINQTEGLDEELVEEDED